MTTPLYTPTPVDLIANPVGSSAAYVADRATAATGRLAGFASDRLIDVGGTLMLALLGVAIAVVGVLRIFSAGANTESGQTALSLAALKSPRTR